MTKFAVEVRTKLPDCLVIKREPAASWNDALVLAQKMAVQMFREDPMASRSFRNGILKYLNRNDMGDPVLIHPITIEENDPYPCGQHRCGLCDFSRENLS